MCSPCLLRTEIRFDAVKVSNIGSNGLTQCYARILCLWLTVKCGKVALVTTDLLFPNMYDFMLMGASRYLRVDLKSIISSVIVLAATNNDPYVVVSTVASFWMPSGYKTAYRLGIQ